MMVDGANEEEVTGIEQNSETMSDDEAVVYEEDDIIQPPMEDAEAEVDVEDMSEKTFSQHNGSVFCVAISKSEEYVLTGGEDDLAYVWKITGEETFHKIEGHKDSVSHVGFSANDKYYFTADLSGYIQLFELEDNKKIWEFEVGDILWVMWHPVVPILLAGAVEGGVWMWKVPAFETKTIQLSNNPPVDATFLSTNRHLAVGYQDGTMKVIDLKTGEATVSVETKREITAIAVSPDDNLIMLGTPHSSVMLVTVVTGKVIATLTEHQAGYTAPEGAATDSVEHIAFHSKRPVVAVSYVDNKVCLWDHGLQKLRHTLQHPDGVVKSCWAGDSEHHLVTSCLDGIVRVWDVDQNQTIVEVTGHHDQILDMKISDNLVVTADDSGFVKVFRIA